jgi:hypothetical protein
MTSFLMTMTSTLLSTSDTHNVHVKSGFCDVHTYPEYLDLFDAILYAHWSELAQAIYQVHAMATLIY